MAVIGFEHTGNFTKTERFLNRMLKLMGSSLFDKYGEMGVEALRANTPQRTGITANSWYYEIEHSDGTVKINWKNNSKNKEVLIAVLIQYGHGTRNGGYVQGVDYINPAMKKVFDKIANNLWEEVCRS